MMRAARISPQHPTTQRGRGVRIASWMDAARCGASGHGSRQSSGPASTGTWTTPAHTQAQRLEALRGALRGALRDALRDALRSAGIGRTLRPTRSHSVSARGSESRAARTLLSVSPRTRDEGRGGRGCVMDRRAWRGGLRGPGHPTARPGPPCPPGLSG